MGTNLSMGNGDQTLHTGGQAFLAMAGQAWKFRMFMLQKLPAAYFSGVRVREIRAEYAKVSVPYTWFSQNPFRSTYFACLAMAAEMSTGLLAMMQVHKRTPAVSMLVVGLEASFVKKATGVTTFICRDGALIARAVEEAIASGEGKQVRAESVGVNEAGETVAVFHITWSFRARQQ
jgi:acyl-coenzyme A thioesterase PaaI-like protein